MNRPYLLLSSNLGMLHPPNGLYGRRPRPGVSVRHLRTDPHMKSHGRMHKTLASLAFAMTATAVCLHWMDPSARAGRSQISQQEVISISRDLVVDSVRIKAGQWRDVEITTDDEVVGGGISLAASRDQRECHFFVDAAGRPTRETQWSNQAPWQSTPHTVRIHIERTTPEGPSAAQWFTVRSLILALDSALAANGTIPIRSNAFDPNTVIYSSSL